MALRLHRRVYRKWHYSRNNAGFFESSFFLGVVFLTPSPRSHTHNPFIFFQQNFEIKKTVDIICNILTSLVSLSQGYVKKSQKLMKIVNIDGEYLQMFWTNWGYSMKILGNMWLIILKLTKNQCFTLSLEDIFWVKPHLGGESN